MAFKQRFELQIHLYVGFIPIVNSLVLHNPLQIQRNWYLGANYKLCFDSQLHEEKKIPSHSIVPGLAVFLLVYFYASATQCWLLPICNKVWNQKVWFLHFCLSFSKSFRVFTVSIDSIWILSSVQFSPSVVSDSLQPHESQHARPPCPSPTPGVYSNSCPWSQWCHPAISSSVIPSSSCLQSPPSIRVFSNESTLRMRIRVFFFFLFLWKMSLGFW